MTRKINPLPEVSQPDIDHEQIASDHAKLNELAVMNAQASENAHALAEQLGYDGSLAVGALEDEIRFYQRRTIEACLELGKRLLILKELTLHGEFSTRLELLGVSDRMARKFMVATLKFANRNSSSVLKVAGTQTKLLELVVLDDGEIDALERGESVRGIQLDEIEAMSVSELKKALREAKADAAANDRVLEDNQKTITKLQKQNAGKQIDIHAEWSGAMKELALHVAGHRANLLESLTALDVIRETVMQQEAEPGAEAALASAREQIGRELAEAVERTEELVGKVRRLFDCTLGALIG